MSERSDRTMRWAFDRSKELANGADPLAEKLLRAKCRWEACSRTKVLMEWGDPTDWPNYTTLEADDAR